MKRLISAVLLIMTVVMLGACSSETDGVKRLSKEGIAPYELSESEKYLLRSFGMEGTSQIIAFHAPKEAISLEVNVYRLGDDETWDIVGGGGLSIGTNREPIDQLIGTFTMQLRENYVVDFSVDAGGRVSYKSDEILLDSKMMISQWQRCFLWEFQEIALNTEIPVAIMVYDDGTSMRTYCMQDYFEPSKFAGMDLVQAVTLEFTDKSLG